MGLVGTLRLFIPWANALCAEMLFPESLFITEILLVDVVLVVYFPQHFLDNSLNCQLQVSRVHYTFGRSGATDVSAYLISLITGAPTSQCNSPTQGASVLLVLAGTSCWQNCFTKSHKSYSDSTAGSRTGSRNIKARQGKEKQLDIAYAQCVA